MIHAFSRSGAKMERWLYPALVALVFFGLAAPASADGTACPDSYFEHLAPKVANSAAVVVTGEVCFSRYAIAYSGPRRTPAWSAVRLTKEMAYGGDHIPRIKPEPFHDEMGVDAGDRSTYDDYLHSGYDRGHMTPADDMPDFPSQRETFSMANMVPQRGGLNSGLWKSLEDRVQNLAIADGEVFVVTGPLFAETPDLVNGRVAIPRYTFKAIYSPATGVAAGYLATNEEKPVCWALPISRLEAIVALNLFPGLSTVVKDRFQGVPKAPVKCVDKGWSEAG
jgi:endonuclease G